MGHTLQELKERQALPLSLKISLTKSRVRAWVDYYGTDGVYISFSGGKDSTVLLDIVRNECGYKDIPAVFVDTGLEYPEIRDFVKTFENVEWIKPKMGFKQIIEQYGYPFISKEVSFALYNARYFLEHKEEYKNKKPLPVQNPDDSYKPYALLRLEGKIGKEGKGYSQFNCSKWHFMLNAPYVFGSKCCDIMKKEPFKRYNKETGRVPITAQMACESRLRLKNWLHNGCNMFDSKKPMSNPMSFWTEQDVLQYIKKKSLPICSVYGEIVGEDMQLSLDDLYNINLDETSGKLKTTRLNRTGCMFCGYGCHLEEPGNGRFELMKQTHPKQYDWIMKPINRGGG